MNPRWENAIVDWSNLKALIGNNKNNNRFNLGVKKQRERGDNGLFLHKSPKFYNNVF